MKKLNKNIPYGKQLISAQDIKEVKKVLQSDFLTQGPCVSIFEQDINHYCKSKYAVACNSATSALHIACLALGLSKDDYLWTSPISFVASSNCALYCGARVDFVDIDPLTYNLSVSSLEDKLIIAKKAGKLPKILVAVHMCGLSCDMKKIRLLGVKYGFKVIEDASHAIGAEYNDLKIGSCKYSDITVFSFHPVKIITTGEGGIATTNNKALYSIMTKLRAHGVSNKKNEMLKMPKNEIWNYQQLLLGFNYRMNDIEAALGSSQLKKIDYFLLKRNEIASLYDESFLSLPVKTQLVNANFKSSYHLYVIRINTQSTKISQRKIYKNLINNGVGVNLHYIPIYLQPFYNDMGFYRGYCPEAEKYFQEAISLPIYPKLSKFNQKKVIKIFKDNFV